MEEQNLLSRVQALASEVQGPLSIAQQAEFEDLDGLCTTAMLAVEKSCRKLKMGNVPWTPQLAQAQRLLTYHRLCFKKSRGHKISSKTIYRAARLAGRSTNPVLGGSDS
jgi:hypothetical protein